VALTGLPRPPSCARSAPLSGAGMAIIVWALLATHLHEEGTRPHPPVWRRDSPGVLGPVAREKGTMQT
jgi:hypothetical protein